MIMIIIIILAMIKLTAQRQAILDLINAFDRHWDADELARSLSDSGQSVGIATVYRGLATLEAAGMIDSIQLADKKRYERADKSHHDHMICTSCGDIEEFAHETIESLQRSIAAEKGFTISGHQLVMFGLCRKCSKGKQK
ncbi:MAG: transcriptional repressor [Mariprofundus sp.]|nr:transcriptional repressor [Mariprofundus sp.]